MFRQITVVPSPAGNDISNDEFMEMGLKLAKIYADKGYQTGAFLHLDTDTRHLHLMVNTVSYATGMKISLSKHDLNLIKLNINRVLPEYGFDPIGKTVDEIMDSEVHDITENFDCLEIFDEILADKANIFSDIIDDPSPIREKKPFDKRDQLDIF